MIDVPTALAMTKADHDELMTWAATLPDGIGAHVIEIEHLEASRFRVRHYLTNDEGNRYVDTTITDRATAAMADTVVDVAAAPVLVREWATGSTPPTAETLDRYHAEHGPAWAA
jgi:hypothetical protein